MKNTSWILCLIVGLILGFLLCRIFRPSDDGAVSGWPLPGNNCKINVVPSGGGEPQFSAEYDFDGDPAGGKYRVFLTTRNANLTLDDPDDVDDESVDVPLDNGVVYTLWLKNLAAANRDVLLEDESGNQDDMVWFEYVADTGPWFDNFDVAAQDEDNDGVIELYVRYGQHGVKVLVRQ